MTIQDLLRLAVKNRASDLHLSSNMPPIMRVNGDLHSMQEQVLSKEEVLSLLHSIMTDRQKGEFEKNLELDFSFDIDPVFRFRVNVYTENQGVSAAFRIISSVIQSLDELNMPNLKKFCALKNGLVLVTGPTGSGKSTTLAAMIGEINATQRQHIITIEDPVEFLHPSKSSLVHQREVGRDTHSFSNALRVALREDPDVILVGELRDLETIRLALTAAETGHLVFATVHTSSAAKTIDRIVNVFPSNEQDMVRAMLSESLRAVISQVLLKHVNGEGRVAAQEVMICDTAIRNLIRENKVPQMYSIMQTNREKGMQTLDADLKRLVRENMVTHEAASVYAA